MVLHRGFSQRGRAGRGSNTPAIPGLPDIVSAYVDPWSEDADGIRYPDDYQGLSGTFTGNFVGTVSTAPAVGGFTDLNMVAVAPNTGTALFCITPDPSAIVVNGVVGTPATGFWAGNTNVFNWPNGIVYTGATSSLNAFGPTAGLVAGGGVDNVIGNLTAMRAIFSSARAVAGGAKFVSSMNFSSVSGEVHMAPVPINFNRMTLNNLSTLGSNEPAQAEQQNGWQTALPNKFEDMVNLPGYRNYPLASLQENSLLGIFRRFGEEALIFKPTTNMWGADDAHLGNLAVRAGNGTSFPSTVGHYGVLVYISGVQSAAGGVAAASTPLGELHIRVHYECQTNPNASILSANTNFANLSGSSGLMTPSPPSQPLLMAAADNLCSGVPVVRNVDDAGVEEEGFVSEILRLWPAACSVVSSFTTAYPVISGLLSALAI
jgi:hypothetical protein